MTDAVVIDSNNAELEADFELGMRTLITGALLRHKGGRAVKHCK